MELKAGLLLIDERAGRKQAEAREIQVAGTLVVLSRGALRGRIELPKAIEALKIFGFRVSQPVIEAILANHAQEVRKAKL